MTLTDNKPMPIGKPPPKGYKGVPMVKVPAWHLRFWEERLTRTTHHYLSIEEKALLVYIQDNWELIKE